MELKLILFVKAFSVENFDREGTFFNKGLLTIIIIYLFYMRDQLCKAFFHVQTVCIISFTFSHIFFIFFKIISTHIHGEEDVSVS